MRVYTQRKLGALGLLLALLAFSGCRRGTPSLSPESLDQFDVRAGEILVATAAAMDKAIEKTRELRAAGQMTDAELSHVKTVLLRVNEFHTALALSLQSFRQARTLFADAPTPQNQAALRQAQEQTSKAIVDVQTATGELEGAFN